MRYVLLLFFVFLTGLGFSQRIQIEGVEVNYSSHYPDGPLYVIRQTQAGAVPEGQVRRSLGIRLDLRGFPSGRCSV